MVKFGLQIPWFSWDSSPKEDRRILRDIAQAAEEAGFDSLWVMDHFFQIPMIGDAHLEMHESYTTLGYLAALTERMTLGTLVTGATYRHPGILVKQVTTLDVLSAGRAWFAIGGAWFEREHLGLGVPFHTMRDRFERLEEALQIAIQMWSDEDGPFKGKHFVLDETICSPRPIAQPRPPIMVGGSGERKTLKLVAKYADACNITAFPDDLRHKLAVLERHCDEVGRKYDDIERTRLGVAFPGTDLVEEARSFKDAGAQHLIYSVPAVHNLEAIRMFGSDVIPAFR